MSSGYIIGITEKNFSKKKRVRPANLRVTFEESEDQKSAKKTKTNVSSPFGSFDVSLPFADQTNIVYFRCESILDFRPTHLFDKSLSLRDYVFSHQLYKWGKLTTALDDVIIGSPVLFCGSEAYVYQNIEQFFLGKFAPSHKFIKLFKWIIVELFAVYLCQFALADGRIIWVNETNSVYHQGSISLSRSLFGKGKEKFKVKIEWYLNLCLIVMPESC